MLKPIKTFLTYLQRNANSSNIFGLTTTTMGPTEEPRLEESMIANEELGNESGGDPLFDPLALDDECAGGVAVEGIHAHDVSIGSQAHLLGNVDDDDDDDDADGVSTGKIILVDVTSLKSGMAQSSNELETDDEDDVVEGDESAVLVISDTEEAPEGTSGEFLNISSSSDGGVPVSDRSSESLIELDSDGVLDSSLTVENVTFIVASPEPSSGDDVVIVGEEETPHIAERDETTLPNGHDTTGGDKDMIDETDTISPNVEQHQMQQQQQQEPGPSGVSAAIQPEQLQGALPDGAEEEEASDGSDSGLGLEPLRNGASSAITNNPLVLAPIKSSLKRRSDPSTVAPGVEDGVSREKRPRRGITFEGVTVYYFPRIQGFGCVPSQGGCTLGMDFQHVHTRQLTLAEHSSEQRKVHRQQLQELNPRSSSSDDTSSEEEPSESASEAESETSGFLQPVSTRQRRALLKAAGVRKIDTTEKDECREIRISREVCGCTCRGFCDPATCACSLAGIKCQVDRPSFPCGCTHDGCANKTGRIEFNPSRVRTHYIHTIMRLNLEGKVTERHRPPAGAMVPGGGGSGAIDSGPPGENGFVVSGGERNWSNGPVRLQQQQQHAQHAQQQQGMVYMPPGPPMHADTTRAMEMDGALVPMNHHHVMPSAYHQPMRMQLQLQPQYFPELPSDVEYLAEVGSAYHSHGYLGGNSRMLLTAVPATSTSSSPQHLIDGLISPTSHPMGPADAHYAYREYFVGGTTTPDVVAEELLHHDQTMHYTYATGEDQTTGSGSSSYRHPHLSHLAVVSPQMSASDLRIHHPQLAEADSSISTYHQHQQQHTGSTGHDRLFLSSGYNDELISPSSDTTDERDSSTSTVPLSTTTTPSLDTPELDGSNYASSETLFTSNRTCSSAEHTPTDSVVHSSADGEALSGDSGAEEIVVGDRETLTVTVGTASPTATVITVEDDCDAVGDVRCVENRTTQKSDSQEQSSSFIDLIAPQAGNAERLEAINDMLASSRRSVNLARRSINLARRSIAAEDDDELRDFRHSPLPPAVTIDSDTEMDDVVVVDDRSSVVTVVSSVDTSTPPIVIVESGEDLPGRQNGTDVLVDDGRLVVRDTMARPSSACVASVEGSSVGAACSSAALGVAPRLANKLAKTDTDGDKSRSANSSRPDSPSEGAEPGENLCEIIKNSIVETAVSH